ncbi:hypothetical protein [Brachyspira sp.]|uniref:hypothetical protein n=1 Tax=Brachyspira sp. TaxID=1977261 RepID=UPI003D7E4489
MGIAFKDSVLRETVSNIRKILEKEFIFKAFDSDIDGEGNRTIIASILYMFLIEIFSHEKYINKSDSKIIDYCMIDVNYDIERTEELIEQVLYFLNCLTRKNILIKKRRNKKNYYSFNKSYLESIKNER